MWISIFAGDISPSVMHQGTRSNNSIQSLWYVEAQRGFSTRPKTSLLGPLPTYLMTEAFLHFHSLKKFVNKRGLKNVI